MAAELALRLKDTMKLTDCLFVELARVPEPTALEVLEVANGLRPESDLNTTLWYDHTKVIPIQYTNYHILLFSTDTLQFLIDMPTVFPLSSN